MKYESIEEAATTAESLLSAFIPTAVCIAQEWDQRIDCFVKLPDGTLIGEMIPYIEFTDVRVMETGERLKKRMEGIPEPLVNEIRSPTRIVRQFRGHDT